MKGMWHTPNGSHDLGKGSETKRGSVQGLEFTRLEVIWLQGTHWPAIPRRNGSDRLHNKGMVKRSDCFKNAASPVCAQQDRSDNCTASVIPLKQSRSTPDMVARTAYTHSGLASTVGCLRILTYRSIPSSCTGMFYRFLQVPLLSLTTILIQRTLTTILIQRTL